MKLYLPHQLAFLLIATSMMCATSRPAANDLSLPGLIITYKCTPAQRLDLRRYMLSEGLPYLAQLQRTGSLSHYHVFFSRYVDSDSWDMMIFVLFAKDKDRTHWRDVESQNPAGLSREALQHVQSITTTPVTYFGTLAEASQNQDPVFLMIPYKVTISKSDYLTYVDSYVLPQIRGWEEESDLANYSLCWADFPPDRSWSSMLILEYPDDAALGRRETTVAEVRKRLQHDNQWKLLADMKVNFRTEGRAVISDEIRESIHH